MRCKHTQNIHTQYAMQCTRTPKHTLAYRSDNIFGKIDVFSHLFATTFPWRIHNLCHLIHRIDKWVFVNNQFLCITNYTHWVQHSILTYTLIHSFIRFMCVRVSRSKIVLVSIQFHPTMHERNRNRNNINSISNMPPNPFCHKRTFNFHFYK